ncbi:MAG: LexA family transcriptional regulator [Muribaculaceae bacterium]|nr:LexA family transcriptional regulator [Muribaculaceae bacterium]
MNDKEIIERIKFLMKELRYKQVEFADKIDIDTSNLSKYLNGRLPISTALINRIVVNLGVSKQWLEDGTDLPFAKQIAPTSIDMPAGLTTVGQGTPVYDIDVTAGSMPRAAMFTDDRIVGWVDLPGMPSGSRIIKVNGDSMKPVICNGDYVAIRELTSMQHIFWGEIYVVLLDDYRLIKYVRRNEDPRMVTLRSANKDYDDMDVLRSDIREMMIVQQILHIDTRL